MTTKFIDVTGKTEDEAVASALAQLKLDRDEVSVEILERAKKGFLGIGASPAKVRVTYEVAEKPVKPAESPKPPKPVAPVPPTPAVKAEAVPAAAVEKEKKPERSEKKKSGRSRGERKDKPAAEAPAMPAVQPVDLGEPVGDEKARQITAFLTGLLEHMECSAQVKVYMDAEGRYKVILEGEKLGALIGRRGETLDAIHSGAYERL